MQRPQWATVRKCFFCVSGSLSRLIEAPINECVKARIANLDASDKCVHDLHWRELSLADAARNFGDIGVGKLVGKCHFSPPEKPRTSLRACVDVPSSFLPLAKLKPVRGLAATPAAVVLNKDLRENLPC